MDSDIRWTVDPDADRSHQRPRDWLPYMANYSDPGKKHYEPEGISSNPTNFKDADSLNKIEKTTNETWAEKFNEQPYCSFHMVSWLLRLSGVTAEELWMKPRALNKFSVKEEQLDKDVMDALTLGCGRCTTFTIQVAQALEDLQDLREIKDVPRFRWEYHDVVRHRLARCKNTGLVIHSSSPKGFLTLPPDGKTLEVESEYPRSEVLSYTADGISKLRQLVDAQEKALKSSKGWITKVDSMAVCLNELAHEKKLQPLCFFRHTFASPSGIGADFDGMMIFQLEAKQLQLRASRDDIPVTFYWDNDKVEDTVTFTYKEHDYYARGPNYHTILADYIDRYGGPYGAKQWASCSQGFAQFWRSACKLWGLPRVTRAVPFREKADELLHNCFFATRTDNDLDGNEPFE